MQPAPHVTVLLGLFDGAANLGAQLSSLAAQSHGSWSLIASDDGSRDAGPAILASFAATRPDGQVRLVEGPRQGFAANFLSLLRGLPEAPGAVAFCDQDDVWLPDRLSRGLAALAKVDPATPALYCSRSWITAPDLQGRRPSAPRPRAPSFRNALVQNIASGNTILLNPAAAALLAASAHEVAAVVAHDWWAYLLVTGAGGRVLHDDAPTILYRQHAGNTIGANDGWADSLRRLGMVARGTFRDWNAVNAAALTASLHRLTPEARAIFADWQALRATRGGVGRTIRLSRLALYRQTMASTAALWFAALTGKL